MTIVPFPLLLLPFLRAPNRIYQNLLAPMNQKKNMRLPPLLRPPLLRRPLAAGRIPLRQPLAPAPPAPVTQGGRPPLLRLGSPCSHDPRRPATPAPPATSFAPAPATPGGRPALLRCGSDPRRPVAAGCAVRRRVRAPTASGPCGAGPSAGRRRPLRRGSGRRPRARVRPGCRREHEPGEWRPPGSPCR